MAPRVLGNRDAVSLWVIVLTLLLSALAAPASHADQDDHRAEAAAHYARGLDLANQEQYQQALDEFNAAYSAIPHFAVLYNIGQAQMALGRPIEAISALNRYLQDGADQVPASRRDLVRAQIALLEAKLAELTITTEQSGVSVRVDDREVGLTPLPQPMRLPAGTHTVTASPPRGARVTRKVTLAEGDRQTLELVFPPPAPAVVAPPAPHAEPAPSVTPRPETRSRVVTLRRVAVVTVAAGLLLGGAALGVYAWNGGRYQDWQHANASLPPVEGSPEYRAQAIANNQLADSLTKANDAITALSITGATLVVTGVVMYLVDRRQQKHPGELAVAWARSSAGGRTPIVGWSVDW